MNESGNKMCENKNKEGYPRMGVTSQIHGALIDEFDRGAAELLPLLQDPLTD